jgi:cytochrome c biogenesis protein CcdA
MGNAPLAFAFAAGMLASVNPCGFSMLPAYLSYFLGLEDGEAPGTERAIGRALAVSGVMTAGFVTVFALMGLVVTQVSSRVQRHLPWVTIVIGLGLVALGVAAIGGRNISIRLPKLQKGTGSRELSSMLLFGISYALSSLSCTIGSFLAAVSPTLDQSGVVAGTLTFVFYGLGMGAIVVALTVAVALARRQVVARFRQLMRYVHIATGVLLVVVGAYLAYYGWFEVRQNRSKGIVRDPVIDRALEVQQWLQDELQQAGTTRVGVVCAAAVGALAVFALLRSRRRPSPSPAEAPPPAEDRRGVDAARRSPLPSGRAADPVA